MIRIATVAALSIMLEAGGASAQAACDAPAEQCAAVVDGSCLSRLGAGVMTAAERSECGGQYDAYVACLADVVERCGAAGEQGVAMASEFFRAGEADDIVWIVAQDLATLRATAGNRMLVDLLSGLDGRLVYLDLSADVASNGRYEYGFTPEQEEVCIADARVHNTYWDWEKGADRIMYLPGSVVEDGPCRGMAETVGAGLVLKGEEGAYEESFVGCGTECALRLVKGFFVVGVEDDPRNPLIYPDGVSVLSPAIELDAYAADPLLRNRIVKAATAEGR